MATLSTDGWIPCPDGELRKLAARLTAYRQRRVALTVLFAVSVAVAAAVGIGVAVEYAPTWFGTGHPAPCPPVQDSPSAAPAQ